MNNLRVNTPCLGATLLPAERGVSLVSITYTPCVMKTSGESAHPALRDGVWHPD